MIIAVFFCLMKKHKTRKQKLRERSKRGHKPYGLRMVESSTVAPRLYLEAQVAATKAMPTGKEWEVTIIGADDPDQIVEKDGKRFLKSLNGRLYDIEALKESTPKWEGVKVFDDHLTDDEFKQRNGMRSTVTEWIGTLVNPFFEDTPLPKLKATYKVVETAVAEKLLNAYNAGVLNSIGLSIDTFPVITGEAVVENITMPIVGGFDAILSVDQVANPAAGGKFERLIASHEIGANQMDEKDAKELISQELDQFKADLGTLVQDSIKAALVADETEQVETEIVEEVEEEAEEVETVDETDESDDESEPEIADVVTVAEQANTDAIRRLECRIELNERLATAKLPTAITQMVKDSFGDRIFESAELEKMIKNAKKVQATTDAGGRVTESGNGRSVTVGMDEEDKFRVEVMRMVMGDSAFKALAQTSDDHTLERAKESSAYKSWVNNGKETTGNYGRLSSLLYQKFGGDVLMNSRAYEAASTSSLATVVKNTVNIMIAADYSVRERWWEPLVITEEVDTIDQATLARLYGASTLDVVPAGATYTELALSDEEETASFVKKGNYVGITLETILMDKLNYIRRIPRILNNAWFNTLSSMTSAVFTVNTAAGPVLTDTGALFNATAVTTAGGHANLLTTALSHAAYSAARIAMRKQTDQPLGDGRRLHINPKFLLVPDDLETTAIEIRNSEYVPEADGAGTAGNQTRNSFAGTFEVIPVPDWTDVTDWALMADPAQWPSIYHIFPRGQRTPQLFTAGDEASGSMFTNDEMRFKTRMMTYRFSDTYDCAPVADFRPLHKSNVAG